MTGDEFKAALDRLGFNQASFAEYTDASKRSLANWAKDGPPRHIELLVEWMERLHVDPAPKDTAEAIRPALTQVIARSSLAGHEPEQIVAAIHAITEDYQVASEAARKIQPFSDPWGEQARREVLQSKSAMIPPRRQRGRPPKTNR